MLWGHRVAATVNGQSTTREATRAEYNAAFGIESPPEPEIPECAEWIWNIWWRLNVRRPSSESVNPIMYSEIEAFSRLTNIMLTPEDIQMLEAIDNAYIHAVLKGQIAKINSEREENEKKLKAKSARR
jgi:hypothetical protein